MIALREVWSQVQRFHADGVSLIPVRDKDDSYGVAKTPYKGWKNSQTDRMPLEYLWHLMDVKFMTTGVALICGEVSGNLEIIDIDVKYESGIDAIIFQDIKTLYPDLFPRLRIHRSSSGGYHILYRVELGAEKLPGNKKLALRPWQEGDSIIQKRDGTEKKTPMCFIETRAEGGYALIPPSAGYTITQDVPIPVLTWDDRNALINLCKSYNRVVVEVKQPKPPSGPSDYYDQNPFDHFNGSPAAESVLTENGWTYFATRGQYVHFTRPGKGRGTSATFNTQSRLYYNFSANAELDPEKWYTPATVLSLLLHGGDKKRTYQYLVDRNFGKINPHKEARIIRQAVTRGQELPANISAEGVAEYKQQAADITEKYPHGIFWIDDVRKGISIDRHAIYLVARGLGFHIHRDDLVRIKNRLIYRVNAGDLRTELIAYIQEEDADLYRDIFNALDAFIEKHRKFVIEHLYALDESQILRDSKDAAYKCYENGVLRVTAESIQMAPYDVVPNLVWAHSVRTRNYVSQPEPQGRYVDFIQKATGGSDYVLACLGYLAHEYKDGTTGYIIVLVEQCEDPLQGGGSGKNVFSKLLENTTTYNMKPGSQCKFDEKFLQSWDGARVMCISDVPKSFDFLFLKDLTTDGGIVKKLFKDERAVAIEEMPKFIVGTNYSYEVKDGGLRRRICPIEFTDFFTRAGGLDVHYGVHFTTGWLDEDWQGFDNAIARGIQLWLKGNRKLMPPALTDTGWAKQFEQTWGQVVTGFIQEHFAHWVADKWISNEKFKEELNLYYTENSINLNYRPSMKKINQAIDGFCKHMGTDYAADRMRNLGGVVSRGKMFVGAGDTPF